MTTAVLYDYWRSSASYRVRIALNLKGIDYERVPIDLVFGAQGMADYKALNPQGFVPMLEIDGYRLAQSLAICNYLESTRPEPSFVPAEPAGRAHMLGLAMTVACDIHPLNNLRVLKHLTGQVGASEEAKQAWIARWIGEGFAAMEAMAAPRAGRFLIGDGPTLADVFLVPQLYNARRFDIPLDPFPTLVRADAEATRHPAFVAAHPDAVRGAV
ncbi:MAG TPA: maleylacetoacetate isomerase [Allosphingosinicella sp.]|jgi:maleylacetoacetate isomerase